MTVNSKDTMCRFLFCALLLGWGWVTALEGATSSTVILAAQADTWIDGLSSTGTRGSDQTLGICPTANYWIYLKFDLASVTGRVTSAELRLRRVDGARPEEISAYLVTDAWAEPTLNGPNRPEPRNPPPSATLARGEIATGYDRWTSSNLTAAVRQELQGDRTVSLLLREDPANMLDVRHYFSREAPRSAADKPQLVLSVAPSESIAPGWIVAEVGPGTKPSFDFDAAGRIHVMGMTESFNGEVWYASAPYVEGPWAPTTIASGYFYGPGDLRVDRTGTAHVAWHNHDTENPDHVAIQRDGRQRRFPIDSPGLHDGWDNSLALDANGGLHQACVFPIAFGASTSLQYGKFDGNQWLFETLVPNSGAFMYGFNTALAVDRRGNVHVAYCQATDWAAPGDLKYAVRQQGNWLISTVASNGIRGRFPSLALDHWDRPHIAWLDIDATNTSHGVVRYGVLNSDQWVTEDVDTLEHIELGFLGARKSVSLALDQNYRPHLAYSDRRRVTYTVKLFDAWARTNVIEHVEDTYNGLVVLRLNAEELPAIVFWQPAATVPGVVRLAGIRDTNVHLFPIRVDSDSAAVILEWTSGPEGAGYAVEGRNALSGGTWSTLSGPQLLSNRTWTDASATNSPQRFYRVRAETSAAFK